MLGAPPSSEHLSEHCERDPPERQPLSLRICADLEAPADAADCVRGTKVQNLLDASTRDYVRLIEGCDHVR